MKKIPTVFLRDFTDPRHPVLTDHHNSDCAWVFAGEGVATQKYDGTCCRWDGKEWWTRREVKPGKPRPPGYVEVSADPTTGKLIGWEPVMQSGFAKMLAEALINEPGRYPIGTFELVGPKINGNPECATGHKLILHEDAKRLDVSDLTFEGIRATVLRYAELGIEGIVWHHPDGRMAKIKARDL